MSIKDQMNTTTIISLLTSILSSREQYTESKVLDIVSTLPFIENYLQTFGKEHLNSLLDLMTLRSIAKNEMIYITNSSSTFYIYLTGLLYFSNAITDEKIIHETDFGTSLFYTRKCRLYEPITVKMLTDSLFIEIRTDDYNNMLDHIIMIKTQKLLKFTSIIKSFSLFQSIKKSIYERLFHICEERKYKKNEIVFQENAIVDGLYLIIKGTFRLSKKQPIFTQEEELKKLDKEINYLSKEGDLYMRCLNGKYGMNSQPIHEMKQHLKRTSLNSLDDNANKLVTKKICLNAHLALINENNVFGDFEFVSHEKIRGYMIQCCSDSGHVIFFQKNLFLEICNETIMKRMTEDVIRKAKLFSYKFTSDMTITENKCHVKSILNYPSDIDAVKFNRNNNQKPKHNPYAVKAYRSICSNIHLPNVDELKQKLNPLFNSDEKDVITSRYHLTETFNIDDDYRKCPPKHKQALGSLKTKANVSVPKSLFFGNINSYKTLTNYTKRSNYFLHEAKQNFLETGIKCPVANLTLKKKMTFHFQNKENELKTVLLNNNMREVKLCFRK